MDKSIIIIGTGIAGLSVGCYGQMNGYSTQIFEMDTRPGGEKTGYLYNSHPQLRPLPAGGSTRKIEQTAI